MRLFLVFIILAAMSPLSSQAQCSWTNLSGQVQASNCTGGSTGSITLSGLPTVDNGPGTLYTCTDGTPVSGTTITVGPGEVKRLDVGANLDIVINGGTLITCGSISATSISLSNGASLIVNGSFTSNANPTTIPSGCRVVNNNGSLYFPYPVVVNGGTLFNWYGTLTCASTLTNNGGIVRNTSTMYVNGSTYAVNYDPNDPNANTCSVTWSGTSQTGTSITNLAPGSYTATITCGSCTTTRSYTVNGGTAPTVTISPASASLCSGQNVNLTASGASTYAWSPATDLNQTTGATVNAAPSTSRTYTVTGTATNGCTATQTVTVSMKSLPIITVTPSPAYICAGGSVSLTASGASTYTWAIATGLNQTTGATVIASPAATRTYNVTGTGTNGCSRVKSVTVNVTPAITVDVTPSAPAICAGGSVNLTASGATTYSWSPATGLNAATGATVTASPAATTTYTVTGTTEACTNTKTVVVTVNPNPAVTVTPSSSSICAGGSVSLTASGATTYSWSPSTGLDAVTGATVSASPAASATYTVTGTTAGCTGSQSVAVTVNALPTLNVTSTKTTTTTACNASAQVSASGGATPYTYQWSGPNGFTSALASPSALCAGNYTVTATTAQGCSATQNTTVESCGFNYTIDKKHPACFGGNDGSITLHGIDGGNTGTGAYGTFYTCTDGTPVSGTNIVVGPGEVKRLDGSNTVSTVTINGGTLITCGATWISSQLNISNGGTLFCIGSLTCQPAVVLPSGCKIINLYQSMAFHANVTVNGLLLNVNGSLNAQMNLTVNGKVVNWTDFAATDFQVNSGGTVEHHGRWDSKWGTGTIAAGGIFKTYGNSTFAVKDFIHNGSVTAESGTTNCFKVTNSFASSSQGAFTAAASAGLNVCYASALPSGVSAGSGVVVNNSSTTCGNCTVYPPDPVGDVEGLFGGGGNATCTVTWTGTSQTGASISGLTAGNYTATITCGTCTATETITLTGATSALSVTLGAVQNPSGNTCNGQATVAVSGGEAPYEVQWLGTAQTGLTATDLCNGQYLVKVRDARGCVKYLTVTMDGGTPCLTVVLTKTNSDCPSKATGTVNATVSGGEAPYSYTWSTGYTLNASLSPVSAGGYNVLVKDKNGCVFVASAEVLNDHDTCLEVCPPALGGSITKVSDSDCPTSCNGSAQANVSGGSGSYLYLWNGNPGNALNNTLCPITYTVRVIDQGTGCYAELDGSVTIGSTNTTCPGNCNTYNVTATASSSLCPQKATGSVTATVENGSGSYTITWSNGVTDALVIDHLPAQTQPYTVTIKDLVHNCEKTAQATVGNANPSCSDCDDNLSVQVKKTADADCPTSCNGAAEVTASGGSGSYIILWNGIQHGAVRSDLCALDNDYKVQLIDAETGCLVNAAPFKIGTLQAQCNPVCTTTCANIQVEYDNAAQYRITCECMEGSCFVIGTDGAAFAPGAWIDRPSHDALVYVQLPCERMLVRVQGKGGPEIKVIPSVTYEGTSCGQNGTVNLNISGGSGTYTIRYNDQQTTSTTISGLPVGTTVFTVFDNAGNASDPLPVTILASPQPVVTTSIVSYWPSGHPKDLKVTVTSSGTPDGAPYLVSWPALSLTDQSPDQTVQLADDFNTQTTTVLTVVVKDRFGCTSSAFLPLISSCPESFTPVITKTEPTCSGGQNGQLSITNLPSGASAQWTSVSGSQSGTTVTGLKAGTYTLVVLQSTGGNVCVLYNGTVTLTQPAAPLSVVVSTTDGSSYTASATGGTLPVSGYSWSNGSSGATVSITQSGNYSVTATDQQGCTATTNFGVAPATCTGVITIHRVNPSCSPGHDGQLEGSFSLSGYTKTWSGPGITTPANTTQTNLSKGDYVFTVSNGTCHAFAGVSLSEPLPLSANFSITEEEAVKINVSNGTAPYTFSWSDNGTGQVRSDLIAGTTYTVHITDSKSCPLDYTFLYDPCEGNPMSAYVLITDTKATPVVSGGTGIYTYAWTSLPSGNAIANATKAIQENLPSGQYRVVVRDNKSCKTEATIQLPGCGINPAPVVSNADCPTICNGKVTLTVQTGMTYTWDGQATSSELINACSGDHVLLVKDAGGCAKEYPLTVGTNSLTCPGSGDPCANSGLDASIFKRQEKKCFSDNSFVDVRVTGGRAPRSYTWTSTRLDGSTETYTSDKEDLENPAPGDYTMVVKDANGCEVTLNVTVAGPLSTLTASAETLQPACTGATGSATLSISGGKTPYTIHWPDGQSSLNRTDLVAGHYSVLITDAADCSTQANLDIIAPVFPGELYSSNTAVCPDEFVTLTGRSVAGYTYSWTGPGITTPLTTQDIKVKLAGEYTLSYVRSGCNSEAKLITLTTATNCGNTVGVICTPIVLEEFPFDEPAACINQQRIAATASAVTKYEIYLEEEKRQFKSAYINKIMTEVTETLNMSYSDQEGHYTLYYYDQAGNLVRTVPPAGVKPLDEDQVTQAQNDLKNDTRTVFPEHTLATTYTYNSLNQLITQDMPDHRKQQLWETAAASIALQSGEQIKEVQYQSADKAVLIANNSDKAVLFTTTDGGTTWNRIDNIALNNLKDIQKVEGSSTAYAAGLHGTFIKSTDNGDNWVIRPVPTEADLIKVYFTSASAGSIMTSGGIVYKTDNGGDSWPYVYSSLSTALTTLGQSLTAVSIEGSQWYATTTDANTVTTGHVWHSTDGGVNWSEEFLSAPVLQSIDKDAQQGSGFYAAGPVGTLLRLNASGELRVQRTDLAKELKQLHTFPTGYYGLSTDNTLYVSSNGTQWITQAGNPTDIARLYRLPVMESMAVLSTTGKVKLPANNWNEETTGLATVNSLTTGSALLVNHSNAPYILAAGSGLAFRNKENSNNWQTVTLTGVTGLTLKDVYVQSNYVWHLLAADGNVYVTEMPADDNPDPNITEIPVNTLNVLSTPVLSNVQSFYRDGNVLFATTASDGIKYLDNSGNWTATTLSAWPSGKAGSDVLSLAFRATPPSINATVVFTDGSLQEFDNSGWQVRSRLLPQTLKAIEVKGSSVWTGGDNGELYEKVGSNWNYRPHATTGISITALTNNGTLSIASGNNLYDYASSALTTNATYSGAAVTVLRSSGSRTMGLNASNGVWKKTGATWQAVQTLTQPLFAIHIGSDNTDLLASIMGRVYKGTEGAYTETTIPKVLPLNAVSAGNGNTVVSVGKQGTVITSTDGGTNWTPRYSGTNAELISVAAKGNTMIAGAVTGQIIYSTNGGLSWSSASGTTSDPVKAIRFSGANTVLALSGTKVLKSTTATPSFSTDKVLQATGQGLSLDIDGYGFVVGDQAVAYRITPGFVYTSIATDDTPEDEKGTGLPNVNFTGVTFHDRETGFITAVNGRVLKTIDGGFHWKTLQKTTTSGAPQLAFNNREQGTILQGDGTLGTLSDRSELFGSRFWYDQLGRLTLSQNAKQYNINSYLTTQEQQQVTGTGTIRAYSYTLYDNIGRITEVGELLTRQDVPTFKHASQVNYTTLTSSFIAPAITREITKTYYNDAAFLNVYPNFTQDNLRPRVASTTYQDKQGTAYDRATHYSYDIHGNVKSLVQELIVDGTRLAKRIDYDYDLVSGKVNQVTYQKDKEDQLLHKYSYDGENRITAVQTSKDGIIWDTDAKYQYYAHGPLARVELGEHTVEITDYAYTLQGWIKGVDGQNFSYSLGYNNSDYTSIGNSNGLLPTPVDKQLYNGNIATMATEIPYFTSQSQSSRFDQQFSYDQLNRIKTSQLLSGDAFKTSYSYDANGNIETLTRNDASGNAMDALHYNYENREGEYKYNTNKLRWVNDNPSLSGVSNVDVDNQAIENYEYDDIGNLKEDDQEDIAEIQWTVYGKVKAIIRKSGSTKPGLEFNYDASGNRISKKVTNPSTGIIATTFYVRDASGNTMAIYEKANAASLPLLSEQHLYGSQRLGILRPTMESLQTAKHFVGIREYELNDHLGNVSVVVSDYKFSGVRSASNYYPFGMMARSYHGGEMRYGFNGKELDKEFSGNYDFGARIYDPRIGRWLAVDPARNTSSSLTPYRFGLNNPNLYKDPNGKWEEDGHFWTVYAMGIAMGLDNATARELAVATESYDHIVHSDNTMTIRPSKNLPIAWGKDNGLGTWADKGSQEDWHGLTGGHQEEVLVDACERVVNGNLEQLHKVGDAWSHSYVDAEGYRMMYGKHKVWYPFLGTITDEHAKNGPPGHEYADVIAKRPLEYAAYLQTLATVFADPRFKYASKIKNEHPDLDIFRIVQEKGKTKENNIFLLSSYINLKNGADKIESTDKNQIDIFKSYLDLKEIKYSVSESTSSKTTYQGTSSSGVPISTTSQETTYSINIIK